jgi:hypothetical protein
VSGQVNELGLDPSICGSVTHSPDQFMSTKHQGDISEAYATAKFLELGFVVAKPVGDNQRYDLIIDRGNGFERVQIKTGTYSAGCVIAYTRSVYNNTKQSKVVSYKISEIDLIAVVVHDTKCVYLLQSKDFTEDNSDNVKKTIYLRIDPPKNNQTKKVKWAKEYAI